MGYSPRYAYDSSSIKEAVKNLKQNLCYTIYTEIKGIEVYIRENKLVAYMGGKIEEVTDSTVLNNFYILDTAFTKDMVILLGATGRVENWADSLFEGGKWWESLPVKKNYIFAVGSAPFYAYEKNSWLSAEKRARISLAKQVLTYIKSLKKFGPTGIRGVTVESTHVILRGAQILGRYINYEDKIVNVLIGIPLKK